MLPLEDIKILDTTQYLPGPFCSMWLGDMGADIIKIEETEPRGVELFRTFPQLYQQLGEDKKQDIIYAYNLMNRNNILYSFSQWLQKSISSSHLTTTSVDRPQPLFSWLPN